MTLINGRKSTSIDRNRHERRVVSIHSTRKTAGGQALTEYVLVLGLLSVAAAVSVPLLKGAIVAAGLRMAFGLARFD